MTCIRPNSLAGMLIRGAGDGGEGMKERPILFSAPMVHAILEGRKTVTRRVVKPQPPKCQHQPWLGSYEPRWVADSDGWHCATCGNGVRHDRHSKTRVAGIRCPYGQPGDRLWVRETFAFEHCVESDQVPPFTDGRPTRWRDEPGEPRWLQPHYRATDPTPELCYEEGCSARCPENDPHVHWKPSIHMPRWASRITLEVTAVRVERLQDMTIDQAVAEGVRGDGNLVGDDDLMVHTLMNALGSGKFEQNAPLARFVLLWDSINGRRPGVTNWNANPWVWVVEFKRVQP